MTADFRHSIFYFGLWFCLLNVYGECRSNLHDGDYQLQKIDAPKVTQPKIDDVLHLSNNTVDEAFSPTNAIPATIVRTKPKENEVRNNKNNILIDNDDLNRVKPSTTANLVQSTPSVHLNRHSDPEVSNSNLEDGQSSAVQNNYSFSTKHSKILHSSLDEKDSGLPLDTVKVKGNNSNNNNNNNNSSSSVKIKVKKNDELEMEDFATKPDVTKIKSKLPHNRSVDDAEKINGSSKTDRNLSTSRGKLKFQYNTIEPESTKQKVEISEGTSSSHLMEEILQLPLNSSVVNDSPYPRSVSASNWTSPRIITPSSVTMLLTKTTSDPAVVNHERRKNENATRSPKSSGFPPQIGSDGYIFENHFNVEADTEKYKEVSDDYRYDSREILHSISEPENNIDRIRNFNENAGHVKVSNIVQKPQGFSLTTQAQTETDILRRASIARMGSSNISPMSSTNKKKTVGSIPVGDNGAPTLSLPASQPVPSITSPAKAPSTENNAASVIKNEIFQKSSGKPFSTYTNRRRGNVSAATNENSLPTASAVWASAALKTPNSVKIQKRPTLETIKKNGVEIIPSPKPNFPLLTTIKSFIPWSTRLQKTTPEIPQEETTLMKLSLEVDAETMSPIALLGPKLMNSSSIVNQVPSLSNVNMTTTIMTNGSNNLMEPSELPVFNDEYSITDTSNNTSSTSTWISTSVSTPSGITKEDVRIDLVDDSLENEDKEHISDTIKNVVIKNNISDFDRFNYTTDSASFVNITETESVVPSEESKIVLGFEEEIHSRKPANGTSQNVMIKNNNSSNQSVIAVDGVLTNMPFEIVDSTSGTNISVEVTSVSTIKFDVEASVPSDSNNNVTSHDWYQLLLSSSTDSSASGNENAELNIILDTTNDHNKKRKDGIDSNHIETAKITNIKRKNDLITHNDTSEEKIKIEESLLPYNNLSTPAAVKKEIQEADVITEISNSSQKISYEGTHIAPTITNRTSLLSSPDEDTQTSKINIPGNLISIINVQHDSSTNAMLNASMESTPNIVSSESRLISASTTAATSTTSIAQTVLSTVTTATTARHFPTHVPVLTEEYVSKDTLMTTLNPITTLNTVRAMSTTSSTTSETTESTFDVKKKYSESTSILDEFMYWTTIMVPDVQKTSFTTTTDSALVHSSSPKQHLSATSTTTAKTLITEEVPITPSFKPKLPPENVPSYLMLFFKSSLADICETSSTLRENLFQFITQKSLRVQSKDQVIMVVDPEQCKEPDHSLRLIPVALYLVDDVGSYDKTLIDEMKKLLEDDTLNNYTLPIHEIVYHENIIPDNSRVIAAMIITSIAAVCFVLLIFLMCTIRNRQKLSYGQRCTPVSVDDYNLDNISDYNSIRRKGIMRASKRSYGNPAFDDPIGPTRPLTYNGLLKACENRCSLDEEFTQIPVVSVKPDELPAGAEVKNRYANVIPLPETRVSLSSNTRANDSVYDYINANYVKGFKEIDKFYIACQAPLQNTIEDFWRMVWKEQTKVIIMLTALSENGVEKCADYLPPSEVLDCHRLFGDYQVTLKKREVKEKYVISCLQLKNMETNLWREITHLWYTNWPSQGVPNEQSSIIALLIEARAYMRNTSGPHVVHCSPGTGRTGTVIAIDICIRDYELSRSVNIPATVAKLRRCRAGAVQTKEQYAFIYKVLALYAKKLNGGAPLDSM